MGAKKLEPWTDEEDKSLLRVIDSFTKDPRGEEPDYHTPADDYLLFHWYDKMIDFAKFFPVHMSHLFFDDYPNPEEDQIRKRIAETKDDYHNLFFF